MSTDSSLRWRVFKAPADFNDWGELLDLINQSFAYMTPLIDPPSSAARLTKASLKQKASEELFYLANADGEMIGCAFFKALDDTLYVGKVALRPDYQGHGVGRAFFDVAEDLARQFGLSRLRLETRVELTGNHAAFARIGFNKVSEGTHAGYSKPTFIVMEKELA